MFSFRGGAAADLGPMRLQYWLGRLDGADALLDAVLIIERKG